MRIDRLLIFILLLPTFMATATPIKGKDYERRKKVAIQQLDSLILNNQINHSKGLSHQNWYIFSDTEPITEVGLKFFFKDRNILKALNEQIRKFNKANGFEFYVKLSGLRALEYNYIRDYFGVDEEVFQVFSEKYSKLNYANWLAQGLDDYYKQINQLTEKSLKNAKKEEIELTKDIYTSSKLGLYGAVLNITKYYFYHYSDDNKKVKKQLHAQFVKSLALGRGFIGTFEEFIEDEEYYDIYKNKIKALALSINKMQLEYKRYTQSDLKEFRFSINPDNALKNHVNLCLTFLKKDKQEIYSRVKTIYLVDLGGHYSWGNKEEERQGTVFNISIKVPLNTPDLQAITRRANQYFSKLDVPTRVKIFQGKLQDFNYQSIDKNDGVAVLGTNESLSKFLVDKIYNDPSISISGITKKEIAPDGKIDLKNSEHLKKINNLRQTNPGLVAKKYSDLIKTVEKGLNTGNPEVSSLPLDNRGLGVNYILIHYSAIYNQLHPDPQKKSFANIIFGQCRDEVEATAYTIVHGAGHNAGVIYGTTTHPGGVMTDGNKIPNNGVTLWHLAEKEKNKISLQKHVSQLSIYDANKLYRKIMLKRLKK